MLKIYPRLVLLLLFLPSALCAQISVAPLNSGGQLAQIMSGPGVVISNIILNCPNGAAGSFACANCSLNMDSGIVLTNGYATNIIGPNSLPGVSKPWNLNPGDTDLAALIGKTRADIYDNCILEFDVTVQSDSI
jgi:hypothetical protein